jgi:hypothetical protein
MKQSGLPFWVFSLLWLAALLLPVCVFRLSPIAAVLLGVVTPIFWVTRMPRTCMSGGFVAFPMALVQMSSLLVWAGVGLHLLKS